MKRLALLSVTAAVLFAGCADGEAEKLARDSAHDTLLNLGLASQYYRAEFGRWPKRLADLRQQDPNGWMTATLGQTPLDTAFASHRFEVADFVVQPDSVLAIEAVYRPFESRLDGPDGRPVRVLELVGSVRAAPSTGGGWVWITADRATAVGAERRATVTALRDSVETLLLYREQS